MTTILEKITAFSEAGYPLDRLADLRRAPSAVIGAIATHLRHLEYKVLQTGQGECPKLADPFILSKHPEVVQEPSGKEVVL
jgi:hypothetical protein